MNDLLSLHPQRQTISILLGSGPVNATYRKQDTRQLGQLAKYPI